MEKLKNGETIGPVTKAFKEKEAEEKKEEEEKMTEEEKRKDEAKKEEGDSNAGTETEDRKTTLEPAETKTEGAEEEANNPEYSPDKVDEGTTVLVSPISTSVEATIKLDQTESSEAKPQQTTLDTGSPSEAPSTESDLPSTPTSVEPSTAPTEPEPDPDELIQTNIHDAVELRNPIPSKMTDSITASDKLLPVTPPIDAEKVPIVEPAKSIPQSLMDASMLLGGGVAPLVLGAQGLPSTVLIDGVAVEVEQPEIKTEVVIPEESAKNMVDWEMLQMCINWVKKEFSADEEALARQLSNKEISYRFLWLYFVPGTVVSLQDPTSKQQMAARVYAPITGTN